jgi:hypothetical protein
MLFTLLFVVFVCVVWVVVVLVVVGVFLAVVFQSPFNTFNSSSVNATIEKLFKSIKCFYILISFYIHISIRFLIFSIIISFFTWQR